MLIPELAIARIQAFVQVKPLLLTTYEDAIEGFELASAAYDATKHLMFAHQDKPGYYDGPVFSYITFLHRQIEPLWTRSYSCLATYHRKAFNKWITAHNKAKHKAARR